MEFAAALAEAKSRLVRNDGFTPLNDGNLYRHADRTTAKFSVTMGNNLAIQIATRDQPSRRTWNATSPTADTIYTETNRLATS